MYPTRALGFYVHTIDAIRWSYVRAASLNLFLVDIRRDLQLQLVGGVVDGKRSNQDEFPLIPFLPVFRCCNLESIDEHIHCVAKDPFAGKRKLQGNRDLIVLPVKIKHFLGQSRFFGG